MDVNDTQDYLKLLLYFNGPIHESLVYLYYQAYTQDVDMLTHIKSSGLEINFSNHDLRFLYVEKRPNKLPLTVLIKVLKFCCTPTLFATNSKTLDQESDSSIECDVSRLYNLYTKFLTIGDELVDENLAGFSSSLKSIAINIIEKAAKKTGVKKWFDVEERLSKLFSSIEASSFNEYFSADDLIRIEMAGQNERLIEIFKNELDWLNPTVWDLKVNPKELNEFCEEEDMTEIDLDNIFEVALEHDKKILCIYGSQGNGKTTLSSYISICWWSNVGIKKIKFFDSVIVISATDLAKSKYCVGLLSRFADSASKEEINTLLKEKTILMIVDDVDNGNEIQDNVTKLLDAFPRLYFTCFGNNLSGVDKLKRINLISFQFNGYKEESLLSLADYWVGLDQSPREYLMSNINRFRRFLKYPTLLQDISYIWFVNRDFIRNISTASELMWKIFEWQAKKYLNVDVKFPDDGRKRLYQWMQFVGEMVVKYNLVDRKIPLDTIDKLKNELIKLFPFNGATFFDVMFKKTVIHCPTKKNTHHSAVLPDIEFLCGWYIAMVALDKNNTLNITEPEVYTNVILFSAGHLYRLQDEGNLTLSDERRLLKTLIRYRLEESYEDLPFIFRFVTELKCIKRLVEIVVDQTEYNEEWCLCSNDLQYKSLKSMLAHVSPVRLIFLVGDDIYNNVEIEKIMTYVCRVKISVWFDSASQFCYGNNHSMDKLLQPFLIAEKVIPKLDFLCGYITPKMILQISKTPSFQNLVLLKLRLTCEEGLIAALKSPKCLPRLLWLEIRFDFDFMDINTSSICECEVALFDVYFSNIKEYEVADLADLLVRMSSRFTGIHLDNTEFTPEGVYTMLKELAKRNVSLCAEKEPMNKFRRWYYPNVSCVKMWRPLTEEQILDLIGYDDSNFYSDHRVVSSKFVTNLEAWNLRSYLESQKNIKHFCYETNNIIFTKELSGKVEVSFKGEYWEKLQESTRKMSKITNTVINISDKITSINLN